VHKLGAAEIYQILKILYDEKLLFVREGNIYKKENSK
jgi:hypothetical protein